MNELMNLQIRSRCSSESNICSSSPPRVNNQKQMLSNGEKGSVWVDVEEVTACKHTRIDHEDMFKVEN